jgi:hypothetical protein
LDESVLGRLRGDLAAMNNITAALMTYGADIGGILGGLASLVVLGAALRKRARKHRKRRRRRAAR